MKRHAWWLRGFGVALFIGLLLYARPSQVVAAAQDVRGDALGLAAAAALGVMVLRNMRWKYVLALCGGHIRWRELLPLACVSSFLGNVTPGRVGELWKMSFAGPRTFTRSQYLASFLYDRLLDVATMAALALLGLTWHADGGATLFRLALAGVLLAAVACVVLRRQVRVWIERAMRRREIAWSEVRPPATTARRAGAVAAILLAHGASVVLYVALYGFLFRAVGVQVPPLPLTVAAAIAAMAAVLPVSVAGLGTREAVLLHFLRPYYDAPSQVILVGMLDVVLLAYVLTGLLALPCWLMGWPRRRGEENLGTSKHQPL